MSKTASRKRKQMVFLILAVVAALALFLVMGVLMGPGPNGGLPTLGQGSVDETIINDRTSAASPEMSWITRGQAEIEKLKKDLEEQQRLQEQATRDYEARLEDVRKEYDDVLVQQALRISELEAGRGATGAARGGEGVAGGADAPGTGDRVPAAFRGTGTDFINRAPVDRGVRRTSGRIDEAAGDSGMPAGSGWQTLGSSFTLATVERPEAEAGEDRVRDLASYIPAGSYAPAVVLSGADAATNVGGRENPIPVLLRITGPAVTAAKGRGRPARVDITGCTVQGSATGDLSAERVRVRLITMTCVNGRGAVMETKVAGYMTGSGKEGVRGKVVSREGPLVKNAMVAGLVGGLGSAFDAAAMSQLNQDNPSLQDSLRGGVAGTLSGGVSSAADTLADYYIARAEQYQPVVSLYGGTKVEIVFIEGVELGG
ncbi:TrbI/VirB10 family protein [Chachezhania sediminis]|uniref:TrbI/VirB10 family protein n=1 Tax=Chachezhania sediminis TaxID=2599291 RepID=UPI00131C8755|nr:TrbI/VirB10 family protein [Chachezhania sediminis]